MAAEVSLRVNTGTDAGTESGSVSGIDFISADNATNSLANRQANPIVIPVSGQHYSYEKWLTLKVDVAPDNEITNVLFWGPDDYPAGTEVYCGVTASGATPGDEGSSVATDKADTEAIETNKLTWDTGPLTSQGETTDFLVLQLEVESHASPGNWAQHTFYYSYDEI